MSERDRVLHETEELLEEIARLREAIRAYVVAASRAERDEDEIEAAASGLVHALEGSSDE